jgi:hypothetical protein
MNYVISYHNVGNGNIIENNNTINDRVRSPNDDMVVKYDDWRST